MIARSPPPRFPSGAPSRGERTRLERRTKSVHRGPTASPELIEAVPACPHLARGQNGLRRTLTQGGHQRTIRLDSCRKRRVINRTDSRCCALRSDDTDVPSGVAIGPLCWIGSHAAEPCSLLKGRQPRPVSAYC